MNIKKLFQYKPENNYNFSLTSTKSDNNDSEENDKNVYPSIDLNLKYIKNKYNASINSDIMIREFLLTARNTRLQGFPRLYRWNGGF
jgi:hypothetical protein